MSKAEIADSSRLPRAMAAGSVPCLKSDAFRLICTSNSPGALFSRLSLKTVHILACQSSDTAGVETRSTVLFWACAGCADSSSAPIISAAEAPASRLRRSGEVFMGLSPDRVFSGFTLSLGSGAVRAAQSVCGSMPKAATASRSARYCSGFKATSGARTRSQASSPLSSAMMPLSAGISE